MQSSNLRALPTSIPPEVGLVVGVLAVSTASTFIRLAQGVMPSLAVATWRLTLASLMLAPAALWPRRDRRTRPEWRALSRADWGWLALAGAVLAIHFYTWITSLTLTTVAASAVLVTTSPFFVGIFSYFVFKEGLSRRMIAGMVLAFAGSVVIGVSDAGSGEHHLAGDALALFGAVAVAVYMMIGRRLRARLSLLGYVFPVYATAAVVLLTLALLSGTPLLGYPPAIWGWLVLLALLPQVVGHSALNWALGHLPATYVALAVLAEPIGSTVLAWWVLAEPPPTSALVGGALILTGLTLATLGRNRRVALPVESVEVLG